MTEAFYAFMREREAIRLRRLAGEPAPWTQDPILRQFKFTNVKREHDRTSRLLRDEFYTPHAGDPPDIVLLNAGIARYFGTIEFMRAVGWQTDFGPAEVAWLREVAKARLAAGERTFTGAYIITNNGIPGSKVDVVLDVFLADLWQQRHAIVAAAGTGRWQICVERLQQVRGFGGSGFMAKETIADTRYTGFWAPGTPTDRNTWAAVGPGTIRGATRVAGRWPARLSIADTLATCKQVFAARAEHWPVDHVELELSDIVFQLCEFDKYERVRHGEGRPRSRFVPTL